MALEILQVRLLTTVAVDAVKTPVSKLIVSAVTSCTGLSKLPVQMFTDPFCKIPLKAAIELPVGDQFYLTPFQKGAVERVVANLNGAWVDIPCTLYDYGVGFGSAITCPVLLLPYHRLTPSIKQFTVTADPGYIVQDLILNSVKGSVQFSTVDGGPYSSSLSVAQFPATVYLQTVNATLDEAIKLNYTAYEA